MARGILCFLCFNTLWLTVWCALVQSNIKIIPGFPVDQPDGPVSQKDGRAFSVNKRAFPESRKVIREIKVDVSVSEPDVSGSQSDVPLGQPNMDLSLQVKVDPDLQCYTHLVCQIKAVPKVLRTIPEIRLLDETSSTEVTGITGFGTNSTNTNLGRLEEEDMKIKVLTAAANFPINVGVGNEGFACSFNYVDEGEEKNFIKHILLGEDGQTSCQLQAVLNKFEGLETMIVKDSAVEEEEKMRKINDLMSKFDSIVNKLDELDNWSKREKIYSCESLRNHGGGAGHERRQVVTWQDGTRVLCDTYTSGGGWTIFQRRFNGKENFYRGWNDYEKGFGTISPYGEFWMGLKQLQHLLATGDHELRVDLKYKPSEYYATYSSFKVAPASSHYKLTVSGYSGNAGDSFSPQSGSKFSTKDRDNDGNGENCAREFSGAWWYDRCHASNLNGLWADTAYGKGIVWSSLTSFRDSVNFSEMKVRRRK